MIYVINWFVNILTLGLVSIATITTTTYHVDEPISELNDLSLNEVFEDEAIFSDYSVTTNTYAFINTVQNQPASVGDVFYINFNLDYLFDQSYASGALGRVSIYDSVFDHFTTGISWFEGQQNFSYTKTITQSLDNNWWLFTYSTSVNAEVNRSTYSNLYLINLTELGIDNLTKQELDDWYDIYEKANENNGVYIESSSHLNNNIHLVDVSVMVISFAFWIWLYKFLKGVVL